VVLDQDQSGEAEVGKTAARSAEILIYRRSQLGENRTARPFMSCQLATMFTTGAASY
jgi:hypothetical protein